MGLGSARGDDATSIRYFAAAALAAIGLAVFLSVAPSPDAPPAPVTATHATSASPAS